MAGTFLIIPGINGKSKQDFVKDKKALDVNSWGFTANIPVDVDSSKGSLTVGQGYVSDLSCDITCDTSVVQQFASCLKGDHFDKATMIVTKDVGTTVEFLRLEMEDVIISSNGLSGSTGSEPRLTIHVKFSRYKMTYVLYDEKGKKVDQDTNGFNVATHLKWS
jgi:type VI protein secretion system component Hcp